MSDPELKMIYERMRKFTFNKDVVIVTAKQSCNDRIVRSGIEFKGPIIIDYIGKL